MEIRDLEKTGYFGYLFYVKYDGTKFHSFDEVKEKNNELIHNLVIDFIVNVDKSKVNVKLSEEHSDYKWVSKNSDDLDEFIKDKLSNI